MNHRNISIWFNNEWHASHTLECIHTVPVWMVYWEHAFCIIIVTRLHAKRTDSKIASFRGAHKAMLKIWCAAVANRRAFMDVWRGKDGCDLLYQRAGNEHWCFATITFFLLVSQTWSIVCYLVVTPRGSVQTCCDFTVAYSDDLFAQIETMYVQCKLWPKELVQTEECWLYSFYLSKLVVQQRGHQCSGLSGKPRR